MTLIRAYGEFWRREILNRQRRKNRGQARLPGTAKIRRRRVVVDVWRQRGIYVLLSDFKPVYVGKAADRDLGPRLQDHLRDRHAGRWDMFSWYGIRNFDTRRAHGREPSRFRRSGMGERALIDTLEALGIAITDPPLNRKRNWLPGAVRVEPVEVDPGLTEEGQLQAIYDFVRGQKEKEARARQKGRQRRVAKSRAKRD